jgi:hypothetical protein
MLGRLIKTAILAWIGKKIFERLSAPSATPESRRIAKNDRTRSSAKA